MLKLNRFSFLITKVILVLSPGKMMFLHVSIFCIQRVLQFGPGILESVWYKLWSEICSMSLICTKHSINHSDLQKLVIMQANIQRLIYENNEPELKTVNTHYLSHLVTMIKMFGPLRGYWCFPFESCLKRVCLFRKNSIDYFFFNMYIYIIYVF